LQLGLQVAMTICDSFKTHYDLKYLRVWVLSDKLYEL
jgi:hypothetical protein